MLVADCCMFMTRAKLDCLEFTPTDCSCHKSKVSLASLLPLHSLQGKLRHNEVSEAARSEEVPVLIHEMLMAGCLMEAWQSSSWAQQAILVNELARLMQSISEAEAQDLPNKDPDVPGFHDNLYTLLTCCCRK